MVVNTKEHISPALFRTLKEFSEKNAEHDESEISTQFSHS